MKKYLLFIPFLILIGCESNNPFQHINVELINEIIVLDPYMYENNNNIKSGIGIDTVKYKSTDKFIINRLFSSYLKKATERQAKLFYPYELFFSYKNQDYSLFIGQNYFMFDGVSYEINNIGFFIEEELKIERRFVKYNKSINN